MDYYVIGHLDNQDDRACFTGVKKLFAFHQENEKHFTGLNSIADVAIIFPSQNFSYGSIEEFRGIFKMLSEAHVLFDVLHDSILDAATSERLNAYQAIILADMRLMSDQAKNLIDTYVHNGGKILATGFTAAYSSKGQLLKTIALKCAGVNHIQDFIAYNQGMYLRIRPVDKQILGGFEDFDIVHLNGDLLACEPDQTATPYLGYIPAQMFGPPEKCYYTEETNIPGIIANRYGQGTCIFVPWRIGAQYYQFSTHTQPQLLQAVLHNLLCLQTRLSTDASALVEIQVHQQEATKNLIVNLVNLSGQSGAATLAPIEMQEFEIQVRCPKKPKRIHCLWAQRDLDFNQKDGTLQFTVPKLSLFESIMIDMP
jgi:hypothetical protein